MTTPEIIRVLLVDDHDVYRHGLAQLLRDEGLAIVGEASGGEAGVRLAAELRPDVVLMDLSMPGMTGVEATRVIAAGEAPAPRVVVLTLSDDDASMLEALLAGAAGYVLKEASLEQIVAAVQAAAAGDAVIPPRVAPELLRRLRAAEAAQPVDAAGTAELSERELEVLRLIVDGRDNAAIASELFISPNTVKSHVASICAKLGVESRLQASVQALRRGLVA
ncbi:MAG TPA: response regulator transcription factor [Conexibacter sp.]|nr:response regulator transcription factor [Conexibacter sp.]